MKPLVCIFAHPDDEAFGPGGMIAKEAQRRPVYVICATKGEAGKHKGKKARLNLAPIRKAELLRSANILGVTAVFFLGYKDGTLSNNLYHEIARKIEKILQKIKPDTILTYEPRGISGHLDHIAMAMISNYLFRELPSVKTLLQSCAVASNARSKMAKKYFIYVPPAYTLSEIDLVVNTEDVWETKVRAMLQHQSQIHDIERIMKWQKSTPKREYFLVRKK